MKYREYMGRHKLHLVRGKGPPLLVRDWLKHLCLDWPSGCILSTSYSTSVVEEQTRKYAEVFRGGLGTMKHVQAHLSLQEGATPRFLHPPPVLFAIRESVSRELDWLEEAGTLEKVERSDWAALIVPVPSFFGTGTIGAAQSLCSTLAP